MALSDLTLECSDCGAEFLFTVGEQEFYQSRGFTNYPKRCQSCRNARRGQPRDNFGGGGGGGYGGPPGIFPHRVQQLRRGRHRALPPAGRPPGLL